MPLSMQICVLVLCIMWVYFVWLDVTLLHKLQGEPERLLLVRNHANFTDTASALQDDLFNPISVKLLVLSHTDHYIHQPLVSLIESRVDISHGHLGITPDMISIVHVSMAAVGSWLVAGDSLNVRRLGVLLFEVNSVLDAYDGFVARARSNQTAQVQVVGTRGFYVDGLCDIVASAFFMLALTKLLAKVQPHRTETLKVPQKLAHVQRKIFGRTNGGGLTLKHYWTTTISIGFQLAFGSMFWNRFMQNQHLLLEIPVRTGSASTEKFQIATLQSSAFWLIAWSWRIMNPQAILVFYECAVLLDCEIRAMLIFRFLGFLPIFGLAFASEIHMEYVFRYIATLYLKQM